MNDDAFDAHLASLGWEVVSRVPPDPRLLTARHAGALIGGDRSALRDVARLVRSQPGDIPIQSAHHSHAHEVAS